MYNEDFVQKIIAEHGREQALIFCQLEGERNEIIVREYEEIGNLPYDQYLDHDYERNWWSKRAEKLKNSNR
jgi:hypothetical protein